VRALRDRRRWLGVGVGVAVLAGVLALASTGESAHLATCTDAASGGAVSATPAPSAFVSSEAGPGLSTQLVLRSIRTGRIVKRLGRFGQDFTNNGLALMPDASAAFFTLAPRQRGWVNLLIERVAVPSRKRSVVARGWEPTLSPDGQMLGYIRYHGQSENIAVKDLATGQTRSVNVDAVVGAGHELDETTMGWVGDGNMLAVPIALPPKANAGVAGPADAAARRANQPPALRLAVVTVPQSGRLSARAVTIGDLHEYSETLSADTDTPNALLDSGNASDTPLEKITISGSTGTACRLLDIPDGLALAFDPSGQELLYLKGHRPPVLWRATISGNHLTGRRRYATNRAGAIAW